MASNIQNGSTICVSTHVGRKKDELGTILITIEDIKSKIVSAKPGEAIESGTLECGDMEFKMKVYPTGTNEVGNLTGVTGAGHISVEVNACKREKRQWKSIQIRGGESATGAFLETEITMLEEKLKEGKQGFLRGTQFKNFLSHDKILASENSAFFPMGVLTVQANIKVQGEETVTHKTTKFPDESITQFQLKGELSEHLGKMFESPRFYDFRIICQGEIIPCHKDILAARSEYFVAMFGHDMKENLTGEVEIIDYDLETVRAVLLHIYTGAVQYNEENAEQLIRAADKYQLGGLKKKIEDDLIKEMKIENAIAMFVLADAVHADKLRNVSKELIVRNAVAIVKIDGWKEALGRFQTLAMEIFESVVNSKDETK